MNKEAYYTGYIEKKALTLPDIQKAFNKWTINPLVRTALLGGAGYFGAKYGGRAISDYMANKRINAMYQDPRQRQMAFEAYKQRRGKIEPWIGAAGALAMGAIPAIDMFKAFKPAWRKFKSPQGSWKDLTAPMLNNRLPTSFDKFRTNAGWLKPAAAVGGMGAAAVGGGMMNAPGTTSNTIYDQNGTIYTAKNGKWDTPDGRAPAGYTRMMNNRADRTNFFRGPKTYR